jgi:hypothetical protein
VMTSKIERGDEGGVYPKGQRLPKSD